MPSTIKGLDDGRVVDVVTEEALTALAGQDVLPSDAVATIYDQLVSFIRTSCARSASSSSPWRWQRSGSPHWSRRSGADR